jgi:hypothetical protein
MTRNNNNNVSNSDNKVTNKSSKKMLFLNWISKKKKLSTEIESVCFNFVVLWRRNEDSRDFSPTREFEEKKDQAKTKLLWVTGIF